MTLYIKRLLFLWFFIIPSLSYAFCFEDAGRLYGISPKLLEAIAAAESNLRPDAINRNTNGSEDIGLMQINSSWLKPLNLNRNRLVTDPCYNTETGAMILSKCIARYGYKWEAVGCYNASGKDKRAKYSRRIYDKLKAEGKRQVLSLTEQAQGKPKSGLYFSVREKALDEL